MRIVVTAGFNQSLPAIVLCELLRRAGHEIVNVIVVSPYRLKRLESVLRSRGMVFFAQAAGRLMGTNKVRTSRDAVAQYARTIGVKERSLRKWARKHRCAYQCVDSLNSPKALSLLTNGSIDGVIYSGGGILKQNFIKAVNGKILNAHAGPLPEVRGMNACEWSLVLGHPVSVTVHFIDAGIDTGSIAKRIPVQIEPGDDIQALRSRCVRTGIDALVSCVDALTDDSRSPQSSSARFRQCYVMSKALLDLAEWHLAKMGTDRDARQQKIFESDSWTG